MFIWYWIYLMDEKRFLPAFVNMLLSMKQTPYPWFSWNISSPLKFLCKVGEGKRNTDKHLVQLLSHVWFFVTPWTAALQASLSITNSQSLLKFTSIELVMSSNHLILCRPLLLSPSIFPSIRVFPSVSCRIRWPKYWSFSFNISPSNEHSGLISLRMDWLDLPAVQGTLKSLLQHHRSKASIFAAQLSSQSNSHIHTWPLEKP